MAEETVAADSTMALVRHYLEIDRPQQALGALQSPALDLLEDPWCPSLGRVGQRPLWPAIAVETRSCFPKRQSCAIITHD